MTNQTPSLTEIWNAFAKRYAIQTEKAILHTDNQIIRVMADQMNIASNFEREGQFEQALADYSLKLLNHVGNQGIFTILDITHLSYEST